MGRGGKGGDVGAVSGSRGSNGEGRVGRGGNSSKESRASGQSERPTDRSAGVSSDWTGSSNVREGEGRIRASPGEGNESATFL